MPRPRQRPLRRTAPPWRSTPRPENAAGTDAPREPAAGADPEVTGNIARPAATITVATAKRSIKRRRRAGLVFGPEPVAIDPATLTREQLAAIEADPALKVERSTPD